jgi:hypothetical protein
MLKVISRVLALAVAALVAGALFVTFVAMWSWWEPAPSELEGAVDPVSVPAEPESPTSPAPPR